MLPPPGSRAAGTAVCVMPPPLPHGRPAYARHVPPPARDHRTRHPRVRGRRPSDGMGDTGRADRPPGIEEAPVQYAESVVDLVGNTPLVRLNSVTQDLGPDAPLVLAKLEYLNPGGSVKDGIGVGMVEPPEAGGAWSPGARSWSRPAATPASGWPWSPSSAATGASSSAPTRSGRRRSTCSARTAPRSRSAR